MPLSRRRLLEDAALAGLGIALPFAPAASAAPSRGGRLVIAIDSEPPVLTSALTTAGPAQYISGKIFDGLLSYDSRFTPRPQLAQSWSVSPDGLTITFRLRPGVLWHDGKPFTSADVAFSVLQIWKKYHSRGRSTFANVVSVDTPDALTAVWHLSNPAPYILSALGSPESQIIPKHLYDHGDVLTNPRNIAPVGTGPFRFVEWKRGEYVALARNPTYWDKGKPYLDQVILRVLPDGGGAMTALETGEVNLVLDPPPADIARVRRLPGVSATASTGFTAALAAFEFNLDRPWFKDVRVRQAFAHAIDRGFLLRNIWYGYGQVADSPIPATLADFHATNLPAYPYDPAKASQLLDAAGFKRGANGIRFSFTHDPLPVGQAYKRSAEAIRASLAKIGVGMEIRSQDFATFVRRVYTARDFDTVQYAASAGPDPAVGTQRFYWSKNFQPGVAFSNGAHYSNPAVDRLLVAAQSERNALKRRALYARFQQIVQTDLPKIPLVSVNSVALGKGVQNYAVDAYGVMGNFADAFLVAA
ncbi:MAG TPA: ABC transporter substrate-binding protein [Rhizomicrobium sp.]|nr:ABC transporter substrate-binding protein [Rhizomicrobium sp.]